MFKKVEFLLMTGLMSLFVSCENFLNGSKLRDQLEEEIAYANAQSFSVRIAADKGTGTIVTGAGDKSVKVNDQLTLEFEVDEGYIFLYWTAIDKDTGAELSDCVEFSPKNKEATVAKILEQENITIKPVCVEKGKINISFIATHGSIVPAEDKAYYSGNTINLRYSEDGDYSFIGWKVLDVATNQEVDDALKFDNNGKDVVVEVLKTGISVKIIAENGERPVVMDFAPGFKGEGVFIDSVLKYIFSQPMSLSSIYWTESELAEMGITSETHELLEAVYENVAQKDKDGNTYYYAYKEKDDAAGISLKFKNYEIYRRGTTENLLMHYGCPGFDVTRSVLTVPVNRDNMPPKITEIEFKVHKAMTNENGIAMASAFKKFYFTNATSDNLPPEFSSLKVVQIDENGESELSQEANDVKFNIPENLKNLNRAKKNFKINVKGSVSDTGSKPAKLTAALKPQYSDYYDEGRRVDAKEVMLALAGPVSDFTQEGYTFDFTDKITVDGVYDLVIIASDNSGNKKEELFRIIYDHTAPVKSEFEYDSTIAQDWVKYKFKNREKDIKKTVIKGFTDESSKEIVRNDLKENKLQEFKGLKCTKASRWHTIEITECDYLGNERTHTERIYAVPAVGMYYYRYKDENDSKKIIDYWTSIKLENNNGYKGYVLGRLNTDEDFSKMRVYTDTAFLGTSDNCNYWSRVDTGTGRPDDYKTIIQKEKDGLGLLKYIEKNYSAMMNDTYTRNGTISIWNLCYLNGQDLKPGQIPLQRPANYVALDNHYIPTITELLELFSKDTVNSLIENSDYVLGRYFGDNVVSTSWLFSSTLDIIEGSYPCEVVKIYDPKKDKVKCATKNPDITKTGNTKMDSEDLRKYGESGHHFLVAYFTQINMEE